jgi:glycosyltransferase involved in cell wall biosynthesis
MHTATRSKLRVLLDLSMARRGYCGIAQDVRLLYKTLSACPHVEVTGLIYPPRKLTPKHSFVPADAPRADRLANQSSFLWDLSEDDMQWPAFRPLRIVKKVQHLLSTLRAHKVQSTQLDVEMLWPVIWRLLFAHTLSAADMPLVRQGAFLLSNLSDGTIFARALTNRPPFKLDTAGYDFVIVQGPRPFRLDPGTRQIVRYHDMIPVLQPDTMANPIVIDWHHKAIRQCPADTHFVCNSEPTRDDLTRVYPELAERSTTIPYMLSDIYRREENPLRLGSIIRMRQAQASGGPPAATAEGTPRYLMSVSTLEPRKNYLALIQAFHELRLWPAVRQRLGDLKLVIVGSPGWKYQAIVQALRQGVESGAVIHLEHVSAAELRVLYSHAEAFVFPSLAEGFGFPPLEAMQCETPVVVSDIAAHRWVMGDAALYCDPYDVESIAATVVRLVASDESARLRAELAARSRQAVERYTLPRASAAWLGLLERLKTETDASVCATAGSVPPRRLGKVA